MTKAKKNFFIAMLTFVMLGCGLLLSTTTTTSVKAATLDTSDYIAFREVNYDDYLTGRPFRVYDGSMIEFYGPNWAKIKIGFEAQGYFPDADAEEFELIEIPYVEGRDSKGEYKDFLISYNMMIEYLESPDITPGYVQNVYMLSIDKDFFADKNFAVGEAVCPGDNLSGRYVRFYFNQETQGLLTFFYTLPEDETEII